MSSQQYGPSNNTTTLNDQSYMESMNRYVSPVNPSIFPHLATVLLAIGTFFTAWFFVYEVSRNTFSKEQTIFKELSISLFAAIFLGLGVLFLMLSVGIYV